MTHHKWDLMWHFPLIFFYNYYHHHYMLHLTPLIFHGPTFDHPIKGPLIWCIVPTFSDDSWCCGWTFGGTLLFWFFFLDQWNLEAWRFSPFKYVAQKILDSFSIDKEMAWLSFLFLLYLIMNLDYLCVLDLIVNELVLFSPINDSFIFQMEVFVIHLNFFIFK